MKPTEIRIGVKRTVVLLKVGTELGIFGGRGLVHKEGHTKYF